MGAFRSDGLGHNLGLEVVAEGVESPDIWNRLSLLGCDTAQGYYISRPKPLAELKRWISGSPWGVPETKPGNDRATLKNGLKPGFPASERIALMDL